MCSSPVLGQSNLTRRLSSKLFGGEPLFTAISRGLARWLRRRFGGCCRLLLAKKPQQLGTALWAAVAALWRLCGCLLVATFCQSAAWGWPGLPRGLGAGVGLGLAAAGVLPSRLSGAGLR